MVCRGIIIIGENKGIIGGRRGLLLLVLRVGHDGIRVHSVLLVLVVLVSLPPVLLVG